jgi:hypothetical protein
MNYRAIVTFVLLISAALPAGANELSGSPARDGVAIGSAPAEPVQAAERYHQFAQHTPAVPPAPECNINEKGTGDWQDGDIIPSGGAAALCTQTLVCKAAPDKDHRPNAACGFLVKHTDELKASGECSDKDCKTCVHKPIKDKCEWWLDKAKK